MAYLTADQITERAPEYATKNITDPQIESYVAEFEETAEDWIGIAFEERTETDTAIFPECRSRYLFFPDQFIRTVTALSIDGTEFTEGELETFLAEDIDLKAGVGLRWDWGRRVVASWTHGLDAPPEALLRACRWFVRVKAFDEASSKPGQIIDYRDESGFTYRVGTPDPLNDRPTGILETDAVLNRLRMKYRVPTIA